MKRVILGVVAVASVVVLFLIPVGTFEIDGPTRLLVFAGAGIVLITALDGLRVAAVSTLRPASILATSAPRPIPPTPPTPPTPPVSSSPPAPSSPPQPSSPPLPSNPPQPSNPPLAVTPPLPPTPPTAPTPATASTQETGLVIDLRDGVELVDQLIAEGELSRTSGPISDDEVPRIVMVALIT